MTSIDFVIFTLATFSLARELLFQGQGSQEAIPRPAPAVRWAPVNGESRSRRTTVI